MRISPFRSTTRPALLVVSALALTAAAPAPTDAPRVVDGYTVTQRVTGNGESLTLRIKVAEGKVRVDMDGVQGMPPGVFMLARDDGKVTMVAASQGMAMVVDVAQAANMGQAMGGMPGGMGRGGAGPAISDVTVNVEDLGAGERMVGYATRKYRVTQRHTSMQGSTATKNETIMELWMAPDLPGLRDGLQKFAETFGRSLGGIGGGPNEVKTAMTGKVPPGYPLKANITTTTTAGSGQPRTDTGILEVLDVAKTSFEAAEFEVPPGIQVMDMAAMMRGRGGR